MAIGERDRFWSCLGRSMGALVLAAAAAAAAASAGCGSSSPAAGRDAQAESGGGGSGGAGGGSGGQAGDAAPADGPPDAQDAGTCSTADAGAATPLGAHCDGCSKTPIGCPTWEPAGAVVMAGTVGSGTALILDAWLAPILAPNHRFQQVYLVPAAVHAGPYDEEPYAMTTAANVVLKQSFSVAEYTAPMGVVVLVNLVPSAGAPQGSSFDFASGPIIPNDNFPITIDGKFLRNGIDYDPFSDISFYGFDEINPPVAGAGDGPSHYVLHFGESSAAVPSVPADGTYEFQVRALDTRNNGWSMVIPFTVGPD
jgi:hypothetical protein